MAPQDEKFQEYIKTLDELQDRMLKAGFIAELGHTDKAGATTFTERGLSVLRAIGDIDNAIGPLTNRQLVCLWLYFREVAKKRRDTGL